MTLHFPGLQKWSLTTWCSLVSYSRYLLEEEEVLSHSKDCSRRILSPIDKAVYSYRYPHTNINIHTYTQKKGSLTVIRLTVRLLGCRNQKCLIMMNFENEKAYARVELWLKVRGNGQGCVAVRYLTPYFGYFILPPRWLVGVMPCPRKSQKELYEGKDSNK